MAPAHPAACGGDGVGEHELKEHAARHREELQTCGFFSGTPQVVACATKEERTDGAKVALIDFCSFSSARVAVPPPYENRRCIRLCKTD